MYKTTERSIEESANLVGLKLPTIDHWKYKSEATIDNVSGYLTTPLNDIALFVLFALWVVNNWIWIFKYSWLNKENISIEYLQVISSLISNIFQFL